MQSKFGGSTWFRSYIRLNIACSTEKVLKGVRDIINNDDYTDDVYLEDTPAGCDH